MALAWMLAAVAVGAVFSVDVASAAVDKGVLSMTPAKRELTGRPPVHLTPTRVSNSTQLAMDITTFPVLLTQELDGSFGFSEDPRDLNAARLVFPVSPNRFELKPGEDRLLDL